MKKLLYLFLAISIISCGGDDDGSSDNLLSSWQLTVDGQTYAESSPIPIYAGGFGPLDDCNGDLAFEQFLPEIDTATHWYSADISHFYLTSDFQGASTGSYPVKGEYLDNDCNFTLALWAEPLNGSSYDNFSNGTHNITRINQISSDNNETIWAVEGNFSGTFEDTNSGESISLTGSYRAVLATYQD